MVTLMRMMDSATSRAIPTRKKKNQYFLSSPRRSMKRPDTPAMVMGTKHAKPNA